MEKAERSQKLPNAPLEARILLVADVYDSLTSAKDSRISPSEAVINLILREQTAEVLKTLSPREEKIIRMRFGIGEKAEYTLEETGKVFGVTRERIRQLEEMALKKLRHPRRGLDLGLTAGRCRVSWAGCCPSCCAASPAPG